MNVDVITIIGLYYFNSNIYYYFHGPNKNSPNISSTVNANVENREGIAASYTIASFHYNYAANL